MKAAPQAPDLKKVLIVQTAFIGDVILATVLIEHLKKVNPEVKIDFLLRKGNEPLLKNHPHLNEVLIWDKQKNKWKNLFVVLKKIRSNRYDLLVNAQRFFTTGLLTVFSRAKYSVGFDKNPLSFLFSRRIPHHFGDGTHEVNRNLALLKGYGDEFRSKPALYPSQEEWKAVEKYKEKKYLCISPASVWFTKQYPKEKWLEFIHSLEDRYRIYLLGSATDRALCEKIRKESKQPDLINLAGELSLLASAALMKDAVMNYVNDSAPMHLASSVNAPTCAVFCSTLPAFGFGPLADKSFTVEIQEKLSCRPCGKHGKKGCPEKHFHCALHIEAKQLREALEAGEDWIKS